MAIQSIYPLLNLESELRPEHLPTLIRLLQAIAQKAAVGQVVVPTGFHWQPEMREIIMQDDDHYWWAARPTSGITFCLVQVNQCGECGIVGSDWEVPFDGGLNACLGCAERVVEQIEQERRQERAVEEHRVRSGLGGTL